jgi:hypothetical protein
LAASGFAGTFEIKVETVLCRELRKDVADEYLESVPDDLAPTMSE